MMRSVGRREEDEEEERQFAFPDLDTQIRQAISEYGAVFPKLNFSSPKASTSFSTHRQSLVLTSYLRMLLGFSLLRHH